MSIEREANNVIVEPNEKTEEIKLIEMDAATRRARLISILDRGVVHDRLHVPLPTDVHGEWVRNNPLDIAYMQTLGFVVDTEFAHKRAIHSNAASKEAVVGDVIFMTCPKVIKEEIDSIRRREFERVHGKPGQMRSKEEEDFKQQVDKLGDVQPTTAGTLKSATVKDVVDAVAQQTAPTVIP